MRVALTQRLMQSASGHESGEGVSRDWYRWLSKFLEEAVVFPVPSLVSQCESWFDVVKPQAVILSGGESLGTDQKRDSLEMEILNRTHREIPVLAICRGAQVANVWAEGLVSPDESHAHAGFAHPLRWLRAPIDFPESTLNSEVNSYHTQVIKGPDLAPRFSPLAVHADGSVEAYVDDWNLLLGLMWHPERPSMARNEISKWLANYLRQGVAG